MKPDVYIYILVMAGVTYLIRMLPLALGQEGDYQSFREILFVLRALRLSGSHDFPGYLVSNGKCDFSSSWICCGADCSLQREKSADRSAPGLWCSIYCRKNNGLCGVSIS